ncbi:MAG: glycosyltransferase family 2 protein [Actinobacteria bacterium]|nr:glycosyltransferase family 2 protein [Actinomycetota bacterium]
MSGNPLVSIVIVLYNSSDCIGHCISSLASLEYRPFELIMVDNGSSDDSARLARARARKEGLDCLVSFLGRNRGFAAAVNHGISLSSGEVILPLNPDAEVYPETAGALVQALGEPEVGIAGCKVYNPDRETIQQAGGYIMDNGLAWAYGVNEKDCGQYDTPAYVACVTGAAFAVRRDVLDRVGLLDPGSFPVYFEETDLCLRARRAGYRVVYVPTARIIHHESVTLGKFTKRYYYLYHKNRIRFMLKNYSWRFLLDRALPFEQRWISSNDLQDQAIPLNKAYLVNIINLPRTLLARRRADRLLSAPRIEDTVSEF